MRVSAEKLKQHKHCMKHATTILSKTVTQSVCSQYSPVGLEVLTRSRNHIIDAINSEFLFRGLFMDESNLFL